MFTLILVKPVKQVIGQYKSEADAMHAAAALAVNNGNIEVWVFAPDGSFVA